MPHNYEHHFSVAPGKTVFVPTDACVARGTAIVESLRKRWSPEKIFYHLGKRGGHVGAMRIHHGRPHLASVDLTGFFPHITRSKIVRSLQGIGYRRKEAFDIAYDSVVESGGKKVLPYGFVQSMALATLAVERSALGRRLISINNAGNVLVSVYVDDIIISAADEAELSTAFHKIIEAAQQSNFAVNKAKSDAPCEEIEVFNCLLSGAEMRFTPARMERFAEDYTHGSRDRKSAIARYMRVVNVNQLSEMLRAIGP